MTAAAITVDDTGGYAARTALRYRLGDTWDSPDPWAVLIDGNPVDLTDPAWTVRAQARPRPGEGAPIATWSTKHASPQQGGRIRLATAAVQLGDAVIVTSTVQLRHGPESRAWGSYVGAAFDCEVTRRDPDGLILARHTIAIGRITADPDTTRDEPS